MQNRQPLADGPVVVDLLFSHIRFQAAVDVLGDLAQGEFTQGNEVSTAEEILESLIHFLWAVDIPAAKPILQGLRELDPPSPAFC